LRFLGRDADDLIALELLLADKFNAVLGVEFNVGVFEVLNNDFRRIHLMLLLSLFEMLSECYRESESVSERSPKIFYQR